MGKHVIFHIEERSRAQGRRLRAAESARRLKVDISKIEETLREQNVDLRLDSFVDEAAMRRVKGVIRELYAEKGYNDVKVDDRDGRRSPAGPSSCT